MKAKHRLQGPNPMLSSARLRARHLCGMLLTAVALPCSAGAPASAATPSVSPAEARTIAEEGFIYGLPMVMDFAVMYDFVINRDSPAWKAPFNTLRNEARVFTSRTRPACRDHGA